jgi:hypothetical protein
MKENHSKHRERDNLRNREYYLKNKEKCLARQKEYREAHRAEATAYVVQRRKTDINFRLSANLRGRLRMALQRGSKKGSAISDLGMSIDAFKTYLESKFEAGMTWDNYGEYSPDVPRWNMDHIKPLSRFDLTDPIQFKEACHYSNIQPMWALPNLIKYNKYEENK